MLLTIPLSKLGTIYPSWHDAAPGAVVAYAGQCATGQNNNWTQHQEALIVLAVVGEDGAKMMFALKPAFGLIWQPPGKGYRMFPSTVTGPGAALDLSTTHELAISDVSPAPAQIQLSEGDVIHTADGTVYVFAGHTMQDRFFALNGEKAWQLVNRPQVPMSYLGKIGIVEKGTSMRAGT